MCRKEGIYSLEMGNRRVVELQTHKELLAASSLQRSKVGTQDQLLIWTAIVNKKHIWQTNWVQRDCHPVMSLQTPPPCIINCLDGNYSIGIKMNHDAPD